MCDKNGILVSGLNIDTGFYGRFLLSYITSHFAYLHDVELCR